jgi:hypothetical protein
MGTILDNHIRECKTTLPFLANALVIVIPDIYIPSLHRIFVGMIRALHMDRVVVTEYEITIYTPEDHRRILLGNITTSPPTKYEIINVLITDYMKSHKICFSRDFIVQNEDEDVKSEFINQLRNFSRKRKEIRNSNGEVHSQIFFTGMIMPRFNHIHHPYSSNILGKSNGNDDFVNCIARGIYMKKDFFTNRKYIMYWNE